MPRRNRLETTLIASLCKSVPRQTTVMVTGWFKEMCYVHWFWAIIKPLRINMPHGEVIYTHSGLYIDALLEVLPLDWRHLNGWTLTTCSAGQQDPLSLCSQWTGMVTALGLGMDSGQAGRSAYVSSLTIPRHGVVHGLLPHRPPLQPPGTDTLPDAGPNAHLIHISGWLCFSDL